MRGSSCSDGQDTDRASRDELAVQTVQLVVLLVLAQPGHEAMRLGEFEELADAVLHRLVELLGPREVEILAVHGKGSSKAERGDTSSYFNRIVNPWARLVKT